MLQTRLIAPAENAHPAPLLIKRLLLSGIRYEKTREIVYRDQLRYSYATWWDTIGSTRASGITTLMLSEAGNFPEIAQFYQREVIQPGQQLIRRILQRGMERGEFRTVNLDYAIYVVQAPMIFLMLWKHSLVACMPNTHGFCTETYIESQVDNLLFGLMARPALVPPSSSSDSS